MVPRFYEIRGRPGKDDESWEEEEREGEEEVEVWTATHNLHNNEESSTC